MYKMWPLELTADTFASNTQQRTTTHTCYKMLNLAKFPMHYCNLEIVRTFFIIFFGQLRKFGILPKTFSMWIRSKPTFGTSTKLGAGCLCVSLLSKWFFSSTNNFHLRICDGKLSWNLECKSIWKQSILPVWQYLWLHFWKRYNKFQQYPINNLIHHHLQVTPLLHVVLHNETKSNQITC